MTDAAIEPLAAAVPERGPPRKRRRLVVSCTECHRRKQKCDRDLPCANCRSRNKDSYCTYETTAKGPDQKNPGSKSAPPPAAQRRGGGDGSLSSVAAALGYTQAGASTLGFLKRIETQDGSDDSGAGSSSAQSLPVSTRDSFTVKEKFKGLIRQLPARTYLDRLISIFMSTFNYQYYTIDPDIFYAQLEEWHALPFKLLTTTGPQGLTPDMRAFPAVLFQVIGTALLVVPEGGELATEFGALKYAASMTFEDLAMDYSESGMAIVGLFDKRSLSITTVQAAFLRAAFFKFMAQVTDSWHMISVAIKDAQELGMHRDSLDPKPVDSSAEAALENEWLIQRRRKVYMVLAMWDVSMSVFLGRPGTINRSHGLPSPPVDTALPKDRSRTPVVPRDTWKDPPTPMAGALWQRELNEVLFDIQDLEQEGPHPKDFSKVDEIHQRIMDIEEWKPAIFRVENPDTRWDGSPESFWVSIQRYQFAALHAFNLMVLHRLYIFHRQKSRDEALKASLQVLEMTRRLFRGLPPDHWRNYNLFFGSFDALVMLATIYIIFPQEHPEMKQSALNQFHWTIERFSAMQERNPLARSAQGVLKAILVKFTRAINSTAEPSASAPSSVTPASTRGTADSTTSTISSARGFGDQGSTALLTSNEEREGTRGDLPTFAVPPMTMGRGDWSMPSMDTLASLAPLYPTYDLIFNDLNVVDDGMPPLGDAMPWQFGGHLGEDTVWQLLNQYEPGTSGS